MKEKIRVDISDGCDCILSKERAINLEEIKKLESEILSRKRRVKRINQILQDGYFE